jgi:cell cycle checkpoint control protein RAD9A
MDHFGPGIELLDINVEGENVVNFTCFTEKAARTAEDGKQYTASSAFETS